MATSGTVSQTVFETRKVIEHAGRRAGLVPSQLVAEHLETALDLLFLTLSQYISLGIKLWNVQKNILPIYERVSTIPMAVGVVDTFNVNLRTSTRLSTGTLTASEGDADNAFDGDLSTACVQTLAAGNISIELDVAQAVPMYGFMPNASGTWSFAFQFSDDGITWTTIFSETDFAVVAATWYWFDVEGVLEHGWYRLLATGATILNVTELVFQVTPSEIPLALINRDDYSNLNNKFFPGRPTEYRYDKQRDRAYLNLWPAPQFQFTFAQLVCYVQTYIQDVGTLQQTLDIPQRWYMAVVLDLASGLVKEIKEADKSQIPVIDADLAMYLKRAWGGESDGSPAYLLPNLRPYTR